MAFLEQTKSDQKPGSIHSTGRKTSLVLVMGQLQLEAEQQHGTAPLAYRYVLLPNTK